MQQEQWTPDQITDLTGQRALVTGVTSGLGRVVVSTLAGRGAEVLMAARNQQKLAAAVEDVQQRPPSATVRPLLLELGGQASGRGAAEEGGAYGPLDLVGNKRRVVGPP